MPQIDLPTYGTVVLFLFAIIWVYFWSSTTFLNTYLSVYTKLMLTGFWAVSSLVKLSSLVSKKAQNS